MNINTPPTELDSTNVLKRMGMVCHYCGSTSTRLWESPDGGQRVCTLCYHERWGNPFPSITAGND